MLGYFSPWLDIVDERIVSSIYRYTDVLSSFNKKNETFIHSYDYFRCDSVSGFMGLLKCKLYRVVMYLIHVKPPRYCEII